LPMLGVLLVTPACHRASNGAGPAKRPVAKAAAATPRDSGPAPTASAAAPAEPPPRPLRRCFPARPAWVDAAVADLLDRAAELCGFDEAHRLFEKVLAGDSDHAHALYHLGLIEERQGAEEAAARHLAAATAEDPKSFPAPLPVTQGDFEARVKRAVWALPADV